MASTYLTKTPSSAGNRKTFTISTWLKRSGISTLTKVFTAGASSSAFSFFELTAGDELRFGYYTGSSVTVDLKTNRVLRDTSSWYHIVISVDTTQATASDRLKFYVNGVQETSFATSTYPSQNHDFNFSNNQAHEIGRGVFNSSEYYDGLMAHFHFIDGTAYAASTFGETDSTTGEWKPITGPSVTYGTNGFFLNFGNASSFGEDSSGNNNDFTTNGTGTQLVDTPANILATLNPLNTYPANKPVLSNTNTTVVTVNADPGYWGASSTLGVSQGKWYWEVKPTNSTSGNPFLLGVSYQPEEMARNGATAASQYTASDWGYYGGSGDIYNNSTNSSYGNTYTTNDIIGVALDLDNSKLYFSKNGTWQNSGDPTSGATGTGAISITSGETYFAFVSDLGGSVCTYSVNFGNGYFGTTAVTSGNQDDAGYGTFEYDVPTGYYTLNTKNINTYG